MNFKRTRLFPLDPFPDLFKLPWTIIADWNQLFIEEIRREHKHHAKRVDTTWHVFSGSKFSRIYDKCQKMSDMEARIPLNTNVPFSHDVCM